MCAPFDLVRGATLECGRSEFFYKENHNGPAVPDWKI